MHAPDLAVAHGDAYAARLNEAGSKWNRMARPSDDAE